mmetsp:Transcript_30915/g.84597  ORF Transcript_30915/g.84597 Transcript_30915/m.84597 type:complete len:147 (+) Transcript_30915:37-477(+)|eukprot:1565977-Prymnesium_polylepis.1
MPYVNGEYVMAAESWPAAGSGSDADVQDCIDPYCDECTIKFRPKRRRVSVVEEPAVEELLAGKCEEEGETALPPTGSTAADPGGENAENAEQRQRTTAPRRDDERVRTVRREVESFDAQGNAAWRERLAEDGSDLQREQQALAVTT